MEGCCGSLTAFVIQSVGRCSRSVNSHSESSQRLWRMNRPHLLLETTTGRLNINTSHRSRWITQPRQAALFRRRARKLPACSASCCGFTHAWQRKWHLFPRLYFDTASTLKKVLLIEFHCLKYFYGKRESQPTRLQRLIIDTTVCILKD